MQFKNEMSKAFLLSDKLWSFRWDDNWSLLSIQATYILKGINRLFRYLSVFILVLWLLYNNQETFPTYHEWISDTWIGIWGHCKMTSCWKWPFWTHPPCQAWSGFPRPTHPLIVTSFFVHEMGMDVSVKMPQKYSFTILQQILFRIRNRISV